MSGPIVRIRPELRFSPARSGDSVYYVVEDRIQHRFWKIGPLEYEVCSALNGRHSVSTTLAMLEQRSKIGAAAGAEKLTKITSWLLNSKLVEAVGNQSATADPAPPSEAPDQPKRPFDPSFFRIPVFSTETIERYSSGMTWLISLPCLMIAAVVWCFAIVLSIQNGQELISLGKKLFVPGSQWWLLVAWLVLKVVHEAGHAIACTRVGARSNGAGLGFMFFAPSPYVDVTSLWSIGNKWSRILVGAAGMLFEITLAAVAIIATCTIDNASIRFLCFSIATLGTFTTVAFNGNPLMRFDGYYILIDLIGRPNLWQDASQSMRAYFSTWIFKGNSGQSWSVPLLFYGICSWTSRMLLILTMGWGLWMTWDGIGLVVIAFFASLWFILPQIKRLRGKARSSQLLTWRDKLSQICPRKVTNCVVIVGVLALSSLLPSPFQIYWPAIVEYVDPSDVRTIAPGFVVEVITHDGQGVRTGDDILRLSNPDLELECQVAQSLLRLSEEKCVALRSQRKHSELQAEEAMRESLQVKAKSLLLKVDSLRIKAPRDGVLISRTSRNLSGSFIPEGQSIGIVVDPSQIEIHASVPQYAWEAVAHSVDAPVSISMLNGDKWAGKISKTLPRTTDLLESPTLGGLYGGPIAVVQSSNLKGEPELKSDNPRLQTRIEIVESVPIAQLIPVTIDKLRPPPGALCSVKLSLQNESIWQTTSRWIHASLQTQFRETK